MANWQIAYDLFCFFPAASAEGGMDEPMKEAAGAEHGKMVTGVSDSTIGPCIQSMDQIPVTIQINLISIPVLLAW